MNAQKDIFLDADGKGRVLFGCGIHSNSARLAELAGHTGFDVVWIEMEHASADLATAESLCVSAEAGGAIPLIRTAGTRREHVLHALEIGGRIIVVPLVNDADTAREVVQHAKYRPLGRRGFNTRSRALMYGLDLDAMNRANQETCLMPQVETVEAVKNLDEILRVEGVDGVFVGPGDLSADLGRPGKFDDPELCEMVCRCIRKTRAAGRHAGILVGEGPLLDAALDAGADLGIIGSDNKAVIDAWRSQIGRFIKRFPR